MAYATAADLSDDLGEDRYLALVDRDVDGVPDTDAVTAHLVRASSVADSYIARWLPLASPPPDSLVHAVLALATYYLAGNRATEDERKRYEDQIRWLRDLAKGDASLTPPTGDDGGESEILVCAPPEQFTVRQTRGVL